MPAQSRRGRAVRWGVPIAAAVVVAGAATAGPVIAAVQGNPTLPSRTAEQLLASAIGAGQSGKVPPLSGTVVETASLGLPALPDLGGSSSSPISLLSGSNQVKVWYGGDHKVRLALPGRMTETDLISDGANTWLWESSSNTATRIKVPQGVSKEQGLHENGLPSPLPSALTPQEAAQQVLKAAGADTAITVADSEQVAGRDAYQLVLAPKDASSLIKEVKIALDGETYVPLRVQVYAKGAAEPAFEVGFSSVTFTPPAPEIFAFTPPSGAKIVDKTIGSADATTPQGDAKDAGKAADKAASDVKPTGQGWTSIVSVPFSQQDLTKALSGTPSANGGSDRSGGGAGVGQLATTILDSAKPVSGAWGSGKLIQTKLVTVLITDDGRLLAGAVTPEALEQAAGKK